MDPITIALGLAAQYLPSAIRWLTGDDQSQVAAVADKVVGLAQAVTGTSDGAAAQAALKADPALALQLQQAWMSHELALLQEETKQLQSINETIRNEVNSQDPFARRMRPAFGYVVALTWGVQMLALSVLILWKTHEAADIIKALGSLEFMWAVALAVLGLHVWKRSSEKTALTGGRSGGSGGGLLGAITGR